MVKVPLEKVKTKGRILLFVFWFSESPADTHLKHDENFEVLFSGVIYQLRRLSNNISPNTIKRTMSRADLRSDLTPPGM